MVVFHRGTLPRGTLAVLMMIVMVLGLSRGQSAEVLIPLENATAIVGGEGYFFCQLQGNKEKLRIGGSVYSLPHYSPNNFNITVTVTEVPTATENSTRIINITIIITAQIKYNNTEVECYDRTMGRENASKATLIIQGAPAKPEVTFEMLSNRNDILLSWSRPFTWINYSITQYHTACWDANFLKIYDNYTNNTENRVVITQAVDVAQDVPVCYTLECSVTASNELGESVPSITVISFPHGYVTQRPTISLDDCLFIEDSKPWVTFCVVLPVLCPFQSVTYTIVISHERDEVKRVSREFSYSSGYNGECIEELVSDGLEEGKEYSVQVTVDAGESGNSSSFVKTFSMYSSPTTTEFMQTTSTGSDNNMTRAFIIVNMVMGAVLVIVVLVLIAITIILVIMWRALRKIRKLQNVSPATRTAATNRVFESYHLTATGGKSSTTTEPMYHTLEPTTVMCNNLRPTDPVYNTAK